VPTIYVECTHTTQTNLNTGIQRVVRNVVRHAAAVAEGQGYVALPVMFQNNDLIEADFATVLGNKLHEGGTLLKQRSPFLERILRPCRYIVRNCIQTAIILLPFEPVRRFLFWPNIREKFFQLFRIPLRLIGIRLTPAPRGKVIRGHPGDILVLLDASWATRMPWSAIQRFKRNGGRVVGVIYDLIPVNYPESCIPEHVAVFKSWLRRLTRVADAFVCISSSAAQQLSDHFRSRFRSQPSIAHFYLGSELDLVAADGAIRPMLKEIFSAQRHVFIAVGSIEPRKNHSFVLDAFEEFWCNGGEASLVLIGQIGWKSEKVIDRIAHHKELGRRLFLLHDTSDTELDYAYRNASALIIASKIEGFGLPVVEAFQRGLPVLCSDIPVFREIADGRALFFALDEPYHLTNALMDFAKTNALSGRQHRTPLPWLTWRESTEQLFEVSMKTLSPEKAGEPKDFGKP
jgi:glycosyltransferase involved in cell wall biosynthesis